MGMINVSKAVTMEDEFESHASPTTSATTSAAMGAESPSKKFKSRRCYLEHLLHLSNRSSLCGQEAKARTALFKSLLENTHNLTKSEVVNKSGGTITLAEVDAVSRVPRSYNPIQEKKGQVCAIVLCCALALTGLLFAMVIICLKASGQHEYNVLAVPLCEVISRRLIFRYSYFLSKLSSASRRRYPPWNCPLESFQELQHTRVCEVLLYSPENGKPIKLPDNVDEHAFAASDELVIGTPATVRIDVNLTMFCFR